MKIRQITFAKISILVVVVVALIGGCHKAEDDTITNPPAERGKIILSVESIRFTEAWIRVSIERQTTPRQTVVKVNGSQQLTYLHGAADTVVYLDSLQAGSSQSIEVVNGWGVDTIKTELIITTLPYTSHTIVWEEYILGDFGSEINGIWGTDDNNLYALGYVIIGDKSYSMMQFNGTGWSYLGDSVGGYAIFGFSSTDMWLAGGRIFHQVNGAWNQLDSKLENNQIRVLDSVLYKNATYLNCWGTGSENMYFASRRGTLVHWDGKKGTVEPTPYAKMLTDVWGVSKDNIIACGGDNVSSSHKVFKYNGREWKSEQVGTEATGQTYFAVYGVSPWEYYIAGTQIFGYKNGKWSSMVNNQYGMLHGCRGNKETGEIVAVGAYCTILHYNGKDWYDIGEQLGRPPVALTAVYVGKRKIVAVGYDTNSRARLYVGTKQ